MIILELLIILFVPSGILWLTEKIPLLKNIGAVALCYLFGFFLSLLPIPYDKGLSQLVASVIVAIAIPLIISGFDLNKVRFLAKDVIKGYGLQIAATIIMASLAALVGVKLGFVHAPQLAGMATGLYTGGTPNLIAIGSALLPASDRVEVIAAASTADFLVGGIYFLLILTILRPVYRNFLGEKDRSDLAPSEVLAYQGVEGVHEYDFQSIPKDPHSIFRLVAVFLLALVSLAAGAVLELLINGNLDGSLYIMISVSVLGIAGSFIRPVRETKGTYQIGQYMVLMFSLGLSMSIDLGVLVTTLMPIVMFFACTQTGCVILHLLLCKLFRIDGGTALITNTAGLYGPPFIAPVAEAYGKRQLIAPGIICSIVGLVFGNLLGIGIGSLLSLITG